MTWLFWLAGLLVAFALASALALWSFGRFARRVRGAPSFRLARTGRRGTLDAVVEPLEARHPGQSGLACVFDNRTAFVQRLVSARLARRSLDIATYIWRDDITGRLLARELIAAADRGVRVRLLLDDVNAQGLDPKFRALNGHPGIEVRLFNPIRNRQSMLRRGIEILTSALRFNRRLHAKFWIVDGCMALTGGRNVGDTYFDATPERRRNTRDADLLCIGPVVAQMDRAFDGYWNSGLALPIAAFWRNYESGLERLRDRLTGNLHNPATHAYLATLPPLPELPFDPEALHWCAAARLVADPPEKAVGQGRDAWVPGILVPALMAARDRLALVTPYFVPGRDGMAQLAALAERGVAVSVVTNALSVTNHVVVHGAYRRYRRPLLAVGVRLFEFAPPDPAGGRGEMLHSKVFAVDGHLGFVGSFNFDLRSAFLNIEAGVIFENPALVAKLEEEVARLIDPGHAFALELRGRTLNWLTGSVQNPARLVRDPEAHALRRGLSWAIGHLPIHSHL